MPGRITIEKIVLSGFRAYLTEQSFNLAREKSAKSLAVFAPNAKGKSSLVDALEFFLSTEGTLARLGQRRSSTFAGREALAHIRAEEKGIPSLVAVTFQGPNGSFGDARSVNATPGLPPSAKAILDTRKLDFIIRGSQLRSFVELQSPSERYAEISGWFGLSSLVETQNRLRSLRLAVHEIVEKDAATAERLTDLKRLTSGATPQWSDAELLTWINENYLKHLDAELVLSAFDVTDASYVAIKARKEQEDNETGLAQLKQALQALLKVHAVDKELQKEIGLVAEMEAAISAFKNAQRVEVEERTQSANNIFHSVWDAAQAVLKRDDFPLDKCPVCETTFTSTNAGSREKVSLHIQAQLDTLASYKQASDALKAAQLAVVRQASSIKAALSSLVTALEAAGHSNDHTEIDTYLRSIEGWREGHPFPSAAKVTPEILALTTKIEQAKTERETRQGERTWAGTLTKIDELISIKNRLEHVKLVQAELQKIHDVLATQEAFIAGRIKAYCQRVIDSLRDRVNSIFRAVHPEQELAPTIRLDLDPESRRPELALTFDFAPNRKGVAPSGYLSDAQVHTLALSLRLAAIEMFNKDVPVIVLDDVITSYDAEHRRAFVGLLATEFSAHQILIATHDERFFQYLKEQLPPERWEFKRITMIDPEFGPRFHDHLVADDIIESLHGSGRTAANEMRQAEEEWLTRMCRDLGTDVRIRDVHKPYSYDRAELAKSLANVLKSVGLTPPDVKGVANRFLVTLQSGQIENFGSHFQENPNGFGSIGDEITRWNEFKVFRGAFKCPRCGGEKFTRPPALRKPLCQKPSCETQFAFPTPGVVKTAI